MYTPELVFIWQHLRVVQMVSRSIHSPIAATTPLPIECALKADTLTILIRYVGPY